MIVTLIAWMVHRLESSRRPTRYASEASWSAIMAPLWNRTSFFPRSWAISLTSRWNDSFLCLVNTYGVSACPSGSLAMSSHCLVLYPSSSSSFWSGVVAAYTEPCRYLVTLNGSGTRHHCHCLAEGEDSLHITWRFGGSPPGHD